jgi:hypothetical protein
MDNYCELVKKIRSLSLKTEGVKEIEGDSIQDIVDWCDEEIKTLAALGYTT